MQQLEGDRAGGVAWASGEGHQGLIVARQQAPLTPCIAACGDEQAFEHCPVVLRVFLPEVLAQGGEAGIEIHAPVPRHQGRGQQPDFIVDAIASGVVRAVGVEPRDLIERAGAAAFVVHGEVAQGQLAEGQ